LTTRREIAIRDQEYECDLKSSHDAFQRKSILALQSAVFDVIKTVYDELDRMLSEVRETGQWPARQWETPTATGWSAAVLKLESSRARVFDDELRSLAEICGPSLATPCGQKISTLPSSSANPSNPYSANSRRL
jgi:hypothetical protein